MDRQQELRKTIALYEDEFDKRKWKRTVKTFIGLSVAFYVLGIWLGDFEGIKGYLLGLVVSPFIAGGYMYLNILIFMPIINGARDEAVIIERLKTELRMLEKRVE